MILEKEIRENCRFCTVPDQDRVIYETENFYVMLSLGPIVEGYLLINSKKHTESCGQIDDLVASEFDDLYRNVRDVLTKIYGSCIFFEHGRSGSCLEFTDGSKHCYHAHMHCLPISMDLNTKIDISHRTDELSNLAEFRRKYRSINEPYLFVDDGNKRIHFVEDKIPRQYLRSIISDFVGEPELWNWIKYQRIDVIQQGKKKIKPFFEKLIDGKAK